MPKQLIIDKSVFRATSTSKLKEFVENYFLILPDVLYYECVTSDEEQEELLDRFREVILAGGYICPSRNAIIQREAENLYPYSSLVDFKAVPAVRQTFQQNRRPYNSNSLKGAYRNELEMAQMIMDLADGFNEKLISEQPELLADVREWNSSKKIRQERLNMWAEFVDSQDMHNASKEQFKGITKFPEKYCLSPDWMSWHFFRLTYVIPEEYYYLRQIGGVPGNKRTEHDYQDMEYVFLLSRANGLLTRDDGCACLAKAAFPEKDVFSDLDEVPDEYTCHWS